MRYINIDLSSDNHLQQPQIFGGYAGEHNETVLQVVLPQRMIGIEYSDYRFDFQTSEDNEIHVPASKLDNGVLSCHLTDQITIAGKLLFNVVATLLNGSTISLTSKTNMVALYIGDSPEGNIQLVNPYSYKDEMFEMIDKRILEINPAQVDQGYNPKSVNAQSGVAIAQAIVNSASAIKNTIAGAAVTVEDVSPIEHGLNVCLRRKNLIPYPYPDKTNTNNGVTFTDNGDGSITANGTATGGTAVFNILLSSQNPKINETYSLSGCPVGGSDSTYRLCFLSGNISDIGNGKTFVLQSVSQLQIQIFEGTTVDNLTFKPQLELGTQATEYAPYIAYLSEVSVSRYGKNLIPYPYTDTTITRKGITFTDNGDGTITANGTATDLAFFILASKPMYPIGTYYLSGCPVGGSTTSYWIGTNGFNGENDIGSGKILNITDGLPQTNIVINIKKGTTVNNLVFKPQLEISTQATDYELYKESQAIKANADGTVEGLTSLSPNMTLLTDNAGVVIECTYNVDTKKYVDRKFEELKQQLIYSVSAVNADLASLTDVEETTQIDTDGDWEG